MNEEPRKSERSLLENMQNTKRHLAREFVLKNVALPLAVAGAVGTIGYQASDLILDNYFSTLGTTIGIMAGVSYVVVGQISLFRLFSKPYTANIRRIRNINDRIRYEERRSLERSRTI